MIYTRYAIIPLMLMLISQVKTRLNATASNLFIPVCQEPTLSGCNAVEDKRTRSDKS